MLWATRMERCESGRIGAPGERVGAKVSRGFESHPLRLSWWRCAYWSRGQRVVVLGGEVAVPL